MQLLHVIYVLIAIGLLWKGANMLVDCSAKIAYTLGVSQLVIGLTVVAMGTSAPEFVVTINAALRGQSDISVSNIIGSNIFNLGFILGGVAIVRGIQTDAKLIYRDGMVLIAATFVILGCLWDLSFTRMEGIVLLSCLVAYLLFLFLHKEAIDVDVKLERAGKKDYALLLTGMAMVMLGGHFLVEGASGIARALGISDWVIGVTIVAAGTSAPEFVTSLVAAIKGHHGISAGNLIGSDIFNLLGVLGIAGIIHPMAISAQGRSSIIMLSGMVIVVVILLRTDWKLSRKEGCFLVGINLIRWIMDYTMH